MEEGWEIFHNNTSISQSVTISLLGQWLILVEAAWTDMKRWLQINQAGIIPQNDRPGIGNNILTNSSWPQPGLLVGLLAACKNVNMSWTGVTCPAHLTPELDSCLKQKEMLTSDLSRSCSQVNNCFRPAAVYTPKNMWSCTTCRVIKKKKKRLTRSGGRTMSCHSVRFVGYAKKHI